MHSNVQSENDQPFLICVNTRKPENLTEKKATETTWYPWAPLFIKLTLFSFTATCEKNAYFNVKKHSICYQGFFSKYLKACDITKMYHILSTLLLADDCEKATVLLEATKYCFLYHKSK